MVDAEHLFANAGQLVAKLGDRNARHRFGEAKVWALMRALDDSGRGTTDADQDAVLLPLIGLDNRQLAHQAARRILANYG